MVRVVEVLIGGEWIEPFSWEVHSPHGSDILRNFQLEEDGWLFDGRLRKENLEWRWKKI